MRSKIILLILTLMLCQSVFAQTGDNQGLVLRGTVYYSAVGISDNYVVFNIGLEMEFINKGNKPVIIIKPFTPYNAWQEKISFVDTNSGNNKNSVILSISTVDNEFRETRIDEVIEGLKSDKPPENFTMTLEPGDSFKFRDFVNFKKESPKNKKERSSAERKIIDEFENVYKCSKDCVIPAKDFSSFNLEYKYSLLKYQKDPDLLEKLQDKWKSFGIFPVDNNGGFTIVSELIDNPTIKVIDRRRKNKPDKTIQ